MITPEQRQLIIDLFPMHTRVQIAQRLGLPESTIRGQARLLGLKKPDGFLRDFQRYHNSPTTRFGGVNGYKTRNTIAVGSVLWRKKVGNNPPEYYIYVGQGHPIPLRRWLWEQHIGPVERGRLVTYRDDNPRRCVLNNLICITRKENAHRNMNHVKQKETMRNMEAKDSYYAHQLFKRDPMSAKLVLKLAPQLIEVYKTHKKIKKYVQQQES